MFECEIKITNKSGLHARPATDLTNLCQQFESDICIIADGKKINPKSIVGILMAGIDQGAVVTLRISGEDEEEAGRAITELIGSMDE